jgi:hypothetical protein
MRYRIRAWVDHPAHVSGTDASNVPLALTVGDDGWVSTGLLDANGNPIMRRPEPIGFLRPEQRP